MSIQSNSDCSEGLILSFYADDAHRKIAKQLKPGANDSLIKELTAITMKHKKLNGSASTALLMANRVLSAYNRWVEDWNGEERGKHLRLSIDLLADYEIKYKKVALGTKLENKNDDTESNDDDKSDVDKLENNNNGDGNYPNIYVSDTD